MSRSRAYPLATSRTNPYVAGMRRIAYEALSGLPSKIVSNSIGLGGIVAAAWPEPFRQWVAQNMSAEQIRIYGMIGIALFVVYWALMAWLKPKSASESDSQPTQTSHGPQSPIIGSVSGGVHFHAPLEPRQSKKRGKSAEDYARELLDRPMHHAPGQRCPEMPVWRAISYIAGVSGDQDEQNCYPEARRKFRQAAIEGQIDVWGRRGIAPAHLSAPKSCSEVWTKIDPIYWAEFKLNSMAVGEMWDGHDHTSAEPHVMSGIQSGQYWSLRVDENQVLKQWPLPTRSGDDDAGG